MLRFGACNSTIRLLVICGLSHLLLHTASDLAEAADVNQVLREYRQRNWTTVHGLPDNTVYSVLQTRDGYIWLGTRGGLVRFDGLSFVVFNQANSPVPENDQRMALAEDREENLWLGTDHGLFRYRDGVFTRYTTADGLWHDEVRILHAGRSGILWIGTWGGLNEISETSRQHPNRSRQPPFPTVRSR